MPVEPKPSQYPPPARARLQQLTTRAEMKSGHFVVQPLGYGLQAYWRYVRRALRCIRNAKTSDTQGRRDCHQHRGPSTGVGQHLRRRAPLGAEPSKPTSTPEVLRRPLTCCRGLTEYLAFYYGVRPHQALVLSHPRPGASMRTSQREAGRQPLH